MLNFIIERVKALLLKPGATWDVIAGEEVDVQDLYKKWIIPLAAITPIATFIGMTFIGVTVLGVTMHSSFVGGLVLAVVSFAVALSFVYAFAWIIDALAPTFGAEKNFKQAFKVSAYAPTAGWIGGIFALLPALSVLGIIGSLFSLYLLFVGLPKLMKPAEGKGGVYTIVSIVCAVVLAIVAGVIVSPLTANAMGGSNMRFGSNDRIATSQLERNLRDRNDAMERAIESGDISEVLGAALGGKASGPTVTPDALVEAMPNRLAGLTLNGTNVEQTSMPFDMVTLTADYGRGDKSMTVVITNSPMLASMQGLLGMGIGTYDRRDGRNFERLRRDGDTTIIEEWDDANQRGAYGRTVGDTFMVQVSGRGLSLRALERAAGEFGERKLTRLATNEG